MIKRRIYLKPSKPSYAIGKDFRMKLAKMVSFMLDDIISSVLSSYEIHENEIIQDAKNTASVLSDIINRKINKWQRYFDDKAMKFSIKFITAIDNHSTQQIKDALKDNVPVDIVKIMGLELSKEDTAAQLIKQAAIRDNVSLITKIPQDLGNKIHNIVMTGMGRGQDLSYISKELIKTTEFSKKRIKLVARDQLFKANSMIHNRKMLDLDITKAIWKHSHGDKVPRPDHLAADGKEYDIVKGCLISGEYIQPAEKINCTCYNTPFIEF